MQDSFDIAYKKLNAAQKEAVDTIEGPVMVIAGPGTGKTQILALRIAEILKKTDTPADGILCLTFTNSGVFAMRERLRAYIGPTASRINISTFHAFAIKMIEEFYETLDYVEKPTLIDELQAVALTDAILSENHFEHLTSRTNKSLYFHDIKSLVSLLKRERMSPEDFSVEIKKEIDSIKADEGNISTRGESKGKLKQEASKRIESLERTHEIVEFYALYELLKKAKNYLDFDDVLEKLVKLVEISDDARDTIRERFLYVLVDEHQDSSGVQNDFLEKVWGDVEKPNVFVVGDDRQLIYGFGGASLSYFENFKKVFKGLKLITLTENYRSTQSILNVADELLKSTLADSALVSHKKENHELRIVEAAYPRDEILRAGLEIKKLVSEGLDANECAILVPKNSEVRTAIKILKDLELPVSGGAQKLFTLPETSVFIGMLQALNSPESPELIAPLLLSPLSGIPILQAHKYLLESDTRKLSLSKILKDKTLADDEEMEDIALFAEKLSLLLECAGKGDVYTLIQTVGNELLIKSAEHHEVLVRRVEIIRTLLHLALSQMERNPKLTLSEFLEFLNRLEEYGSDIPLATLGSDHGVKVMTLHGSKGLEFEYVYIAHLDEKNLLGRKHNAFTLPESVKERVHIKGEEEIKRELYVAITRAKKFCTLSYSSSGHNGAPLELSHIIADMKDSFVTVDKDDTEKFIEESGLDIFIKSGEKESDPVTKEGLAKLVKEEYFKKKLAVTHLNNFFECPWKWYFRNFLQIPEPKSASLEFGNLVHGTLEKILKKKIGVDAESIKETVKTGVEKLSGFSDKDLAEMEKEANEVLLSWVADRMPNLESAFESEKTLNYRDPDFEHLEITGKIDLSEEVSEGELRVTDFKTGSVKKKTEIEKETEEGRMSDYLRQLSMYSYLVSRYSDGNSRVVESRLEFLEASNKKESIYKTVITEEEIKRLIADINDFDQYLSSGEWIDRKCEFKPWKSGEVCEYCHLAEIYKNK